MSTLNNLQFCKVPNLASARTFTPDAPPFFAKPSHISSKVNSNNWAQYHLFQEVFLECHLIATHLHLKIRPTVFVLLQSLLHNFFTGLIVIHLHLCPFHETTFLEGRNDVFLIFAFTGPAIQNKFSGYLVLEHPEGN